MAAILKCFPTTSHENSQVITIKWADREVEVDLPVDRLPNHRLNTEASTKSGVPDQFLKIAADTATVEPGHDRGTGNGSEQGKKKCDIDLERRL